MFNGRQNRNLSFEVLKAFQTSSEPRVQLARAARAIASVLKADMCLMLVRGVDLETFRLRTVAGPGVTGPVVYDQRLERTLQEMADTGCIYQWCRGKEDDPPVPRQLAEGLKSAMVVPVSRRNRTIAVFVVGYIKRGCFAARRQRDIENLSEILAPLLRGTLSHLYQARKNELAGELIRVSENLGTEGKVQNCIAGIARAGTELTNSAGAIIRLEEDGELKVKAYYAAAVPGTRSIETPNDLPFAEQALNAGRTVLENNVHLTGEDQGTPVCRNLMCVPFSDREYRGVLTLFDRENRDGMTPFTRLEREVTRSLLRVGMMALHHISNENEILKISRSLELRVRELTLLHQISRAAIDQSDLDVVLRSLLEAVTNVEGFGFNRAFLFIHERESRELKGAFGVEALEVSEPGEEGMGIEPHRFVSHRNIDDVITGLSIPVEPGAGILSKSVLERRSFRIRTPGDRDLIGSKIVQHLGSVQSFAVSPLLSEDEVLGVIWVDNFRTVRPVRLEDFRLLVTAAAQAALAMERATRVEALDLLNSQLHDLQNQLIQWEKMAALGEMAASVAHDIRNPLVSIGGFTRRLEKLLPDDNKGRKYAQIIIQEVDRLEWTLDNVMSYARSYGTIDRKPVKLYGLLLECAELFRENFKKKRVTLTSKFERGIPEVLLDERQIKQALINILFNAGESVPDNSDVNLSAHLSEREGNDYIVIEVADNGHGIDPEVLEDVFKPFFTTKATGTGLGLAIALRAISGHGGEIQVDNRYGEGVTFRIYIPASRVLGP